MDVYLLKDYSPIEFGRTISWVKGRSDVYYFDLRSRGTITPIIRSYTENDFSKVKGVVRLKRKR